MRLLVSELYIYQNARCNSKKMQVPLLYGREESHELTKSFIFRIIRNPKYIQWKNVKILIFKEVLHIQDA